MSKTPKPIADALAAAKAAEPMTADAPVEAAPKEPLPETEPPPKQTDEERKNRESVRRLMRSQGRAVAWVVAKTYGWTAEKFDRFADSEARKADQKARLMRGDDAPADGAGGGSPDKEPPAAKPPRPAIAPLPPTSPVRPLGVLGKAYYYLNQANELIELAAKDHAAAGLRDLFRGTTGLQFLWDTWPKFDSMGNRSGFDASKAADTMVAACADAGVKDVYGLVRGQGAWRDEEGGLVLHCGDAVFHKGEWVRPDLLGEHIYPAYGAAVRPAKSSEGVEAAAKEMLTLFDTWRWRALNEGGEGDYRWNGFKMPSIIMLGFTTAAQFGGALDWRPMVWVTGDWGGGKSTFLDLVSHLLGGDLVKAADATPAGVWTVLGPSTRPVLLDEVENDPLNTRNKNLVGLARKAASGDVILRSSAEHKAAQFQARSTFLFSSIIHPPMHGQDQSRFTIFDVAKQEGVKPLTLDFAKIRRIGRLLRARIVENWARWPETLAVWSSSLGDIGHQAREQKQYGTLLAMFDMIMGREIFDSDTRTEFCAQFPVSKTKAPSNAESFLTFLLSVGIEMKSNGIQMTIRTLIEAVSGHWMKRRHKGDAGDWRVQWQEMDGNEQRAAEADKDGEVVSGQVARDQLDARGIFVRSVEGQWVVQIPNQHENFRRLVNHSEWRGDPGTPGGWAQALRRLDGAREVNSRKIGGRGWSVPLNVFLMEGDDT